MIGRWGDYHDRIIRNRKGIFEWPFLLINSDRRDYFFSTSAKTESFCTAASGE